MAPSISVAIAALLALAFVCTPAAALVRSPARKFGFHHSRSCCPFDPRELCDFHFAGYDFLVPTFRLNDGVPGDHPVAPPNPSKRTIVWKGHVDAFSPPLMSFHTGLPLIAASSNLNATFISCHKNLSATHKNAGQQFYLSGTVDGVGKLYTRTWQKQTYNDTALAPHQNGIKWYENKCILIPITEAAVKDKNDNTMNLGKGDGMDDIFPLNRRCIVIRTTP